MQTRLNPESEWLEADGRGGFASGTAAGYRTRRYHALLLTAVNPPTDRFVLVNGLETWVETPSGRYPLSTQHYAPDVFHPDGQTRLEEFTCDRWPRWVFRLDDGTRIEQELFVPRGRSMVALRWKILEGAADAALSVRLLMSGRDYHALHGENSGFRFEPERSGPALVWRPYEGVPSTTAIANADYDHEPVWYRNFLYGQERERGLDCLEDLASPGAFRWNLRENEAVLILSAEPAGADVATDVDPRALYTRMRADEAARRQQAHCQPFDRAAESYIVRRGSGRSIVAGYPWFTDWGRDTFIALRGLCLARGQLEVARDILRDWAGTVSQGMLPNRFPDRGEEPEFNSVDASLWYVIAVDDYLRRLAAPSRRGKKQRADDESALREAVLRILDGYHAGTRYGIRCDDDGLLACGEPGVQLTWMDAKIGDWVVTPRTGKPVEVNALWLNALAIGARFDARWQSAFDRGLASFRARYWNEAERSLYDVIDENHVPGQVDCAVRPNQIFAVGGLPLTLVEPEQAAAIVETVEARLLTPVGLRSLAPSSPGYVGRYGGGVHQRDSAYHQGTVWPWLIGPFVEAWVRVHGDVPGVRQTARDRFVRPLLERMQSEGFGHVAEIADGDPPHAFRGCPFQAWSLGEVIRLCNCVLAGETRPEIAHSSGHLTVEALAIP